MKKISTLLLGLFLFVTVQAQKNISFEESVLNRASFLPTTLSHLQWITGTHDYSWVREGLTGEELVSSSGSGKKVSVLVTLAQLNAVLIAKGQTSLEPERKFPTIKWIDASTFTYEGRDYTVRYNVNNKSLNTFLRPVSPAGFANPDAASSNLTAYTVGNNLFILKDGKTLQVTNDMNNGVVNGVSVHREEFGVYKGTFWSPSSKLLAFYRMDQSMVTEYPILEIGSLPAITRMIRYPMAGGASHQVTLGVYNIETAKTIFLQTGAPAEQYLTNITWSPDNLSIYIAVVNREQNEMKLNRYNATTGAFEKTLFEEKNTKWVEPKHPLQFLPGKNGEFVWQSERSGYNGLYHYKTDGTLLAQLTPTTGSSAVIVMEIYGFDSKNTTLYFQAAPAGTCNRTIMSVQMKAGSNIVNLISPAEGVSNAQFSTDYTQFICNYSNNKTPRTISIIKNDGKVLGDIHSAPNPFDGYNKCTLNLFTITAADGVTPLWCRTILPPGFDSTKKYPTLTYVYNGPQVQLITNSYLGAGSADLFLYCMAQKGFVVFFVDGRGSGNRGLEFAQAVYRHLGTQEIADQLMGSNYLKSKSWADATRMAVYGWSYGGFMTTSLMTRSPNTYKCGVAGGAVIDWALYEVMYTERYMDTPQENPEGYKEASTLNYVKNLKGKLLMIHGTSDDVVVWQHSLQYSQAAVEAGVQIDYYMYPGHAHNVRGKDRVHLYVKIADYIITNT